MSVHSMSCKDIGKATGIGVRAIQCVKKLWQLLGKVVNKALDNGRPCILTSLEVSVWEFPICITFVSLLYLFQLTVPGEPCREEARYNGLRNAKCTFYCVQCWSWWKYYNMGPVWAWIYMKEGMSQNDYLFTWSYLQVIILLLDYASCLRTCSGKTGISNRHWGALSFWNTCFPGWVCLQSHNWKPHHGLGTIRTKSTPTWLLCERTIASLCQFNLCT